MNPEHVTSLLRQRAPDMADVTLDQIVFAARIQQALHRPIPRSEGNIVDHADGCDYGDDAWYEGTGSGDGHATDGSPEVQAAMYGPPCRPLKPSETPYLCSAEHGDGTYTEPWPCWEALVAAAALTQLGARA